MVSETIAWLIGRGAIHGFVQERPDELRSSSQWRRVQQLLFFADETRDRIDVVAAHCALIAAIHAEGWSRKDRSD
jgi:hypothetical protein